MFNLKAVFSYVMDIAFPFTDEMLPVVTKEINTKVLNPQKRLELFVETALEECAFEINENTPKQFEGVSLLKKLQVKLMQERASQPWGLYKQLLNLEVADISKCLDAACIKQAENAIAGIKEHGTFSRFLQNSNANGRPRPCIALKRTVMACAA